LRTGNNGCPARVKASELETLEAEPRVRPNCFAKSSGYPGECRQGGIEPLDQPIGALVMGAMVVVMMSVMMVPVVRRRKAGARKQTQRNRDSDELGHDSDPTKVSIPGQLLAYLGPERESCQLNTCLSSNAEYLTKRGKAFLIRQ
jgi:hypothetical protein